MSSAFDTIKRDKLMEILETFINEDEIRMIRLLLSNTTLQIKTDVKSEPFSSNIGSPQGDGISGTLINIYFEHSLRKIRQKNEEGNIFIDHPYSKKPEIPSEAIYADDADILTTDDMKKEKLDDNVISMKTTCW